MLGKCRRAGPCALGLAGFVQQDDPVDGPNGAPYPLDDFEALVQSADVVAHFVADLVHRALSALGDEGSAAATVAVHTQPDTHASSDDRAAKLDSVQYGANESPGLTAMTTATIVVVEDLETDARFGEFRSRAIALGVRSCVSLPLVSAERTIGVLNLYSRGPYAFGRSELETAKRLTDEAGRAFRFVLALARHLETNAQLRIALSARTEVDQAIGVVMYHYQTDADRALALLVATSRDRNSTLAVVAADVKAAATAPTDGFWT